MMINTAGQIISSVGNKIRNAVHLPHKEAEVALSAEQMVKIEERLNRVDFLARGRTDLANERTMLAYIRTSVSLFLLAAALVRFFDDRIFVYLGAATFIVGICIIVYGLSRYTKMQDKIHTY